MFTNLLDKISAGGVWFAALSCSACFPALGALASALGIGVLSEYEGIAITILLPLFALLALIANIMSAIQHKKLLRGVLGVLGPALILLTLYPLWQYSWSTYLFYFAICLMVIMSLLDIVKPAKEVSCKL